jgi:hypothetical protein
VGRSHAAQSLLPPPALALGNVEARAPKRESSEPHVVADPLCPELAVDHAGAEERPQAQERCCRRRPGLRYESRRVADGYARRVTRDPGEDLWQPLSEGCRGFEERMYDDSTSSAKP